MREEHKNPEDEFSLESILAEFKSEAFIEGQQKTPADKLEEATDKIVEETLGKLDIYKQSEEASPPPTAWISHAKTEEEIEEVAEEKPQVIEPRPQVEAPIIEEVYTEEALPVEELLLAEEQFPLESILAEAHATFAEKPITNETEQATFTAQETVQEMVQEEADEPTLVDTNEFIQADVTEENIEETVQETQVLPEKVSKNGARLRERKQQRHIEPGEVIEIPLSGRFSLDEKEQSAEDAGEELLKAYATQEDIETEATDEETGIFAGILGRFSRKKEVDEDWNDEPKVVEDVGEYDPEDLLEDEITLQRAAGKYGRNVGAYQMRGVGACLIALFMLLFTALGDGGRNLPGMMGTVQGLTAVLLFGLVLVMLMTAEVVATGLLDLVRLRPGAESLVTIAALSVLADGLHVINAGLENRTLPYAAVVAFALGAYLLGLKSVRNAMKLSLRTAAMGRAPYIVTSNRATGQKGFSLVKTKGETEGFVRKIQQMDFSEYIYQFKAPIAMFCSLIFALLTATFYANEITATFHYFSAMMVVTAGFSGLLVYGVPFGTLAQKLAKLGASLAGWGGATEVSTASGLIVTDGDVFPKGTLSVSGVRVFQKPKEETVIAYTCAVVIASACGLSETFADIQKKQKLPVYQAENLSCYEGGGIGATVQGEEVIVGSVNLMNLLGIRLPQNLNVKNAVFVSMDGELMAVFAIDYVPLNSVKDALNSLMHAKVKPLFAFRDFNISPMMMQTKFMIDAKKIEFLSYEERYHLSALAPETDARPFAILSREGLAPLAYVMLGGRRLKNAVILGTVLSVLSSAIGFIMLASFFLMDSARTISSTNLFFYLLAWMIGICFIAKSVKVD